MQGLRPFSSSIPKTLKKYLRKSGYNYSNIVDNWANIVPKNISDFCYPSSVKMNKEMKDGTLELNVIHGKELEIEYKKKEIIDKINNFFGYNSINKIKLKIVHEKLSKQPKVFPKIKNLSKKNEKISKIKNDQLKNSLNTLIKAFNEKTK